MPRLTASHPTIPRLEVTTCGQVLSNGRVLKASRLPNGYWRINLKRGGRQRTLLVHRLVAETFICNPDGLPYVNHKDGDKDNNQRENLEWVTPSQNAQHAWDTGLVVAYERKPVHRAALAHIAKTQPRGRRGHCIASQQAN